MKTQNPPLAIDAFRAFAPESTHTVHAVLMNGRGGKTHVYGDAARRIFPRSALKPLQAIALVESGAAEAFGVSDGELALACASHGGEDKHIEAVGRWLARLGLDDAALECGAHTPYAAPCKQACVLCNNCSGKHAGMLTLSLFLKAPHAGYVSPLHPVQQKILATLSEMCGVSLSARDCGIDGCSAPNPLMMLESLATGFSRLMNPEDLPRARAEACRRILAAMRAHPDLVAGTERLDTALLTVSGGKIVSKVGAEGNYVAIIPDQDTVIALKAEDGAIRASQAALYALLEKHGLASAEVLDAVRPLCLPVLKNWRGTDVGHIAVRD